MPLFYLGRNMWSSSHLALVGPEEEEIVLPRYRRYQLVFLLLALGEIIQVLSNLQHRTNPLMFLLLGREEGRQFNKKMKVQLQERGPIYQPLPQEVVPVLGQGEEVSLLQDRTEIQETRGEGYP